MIFNFLFAMKYYLLHLSFLIFLLQSCSDQTVSNLSSFYVSLDSLSTPKAYEFHQTNGVDTALSHYWHISKREDSTQWLIEWERSDANFIPDMAITEQIVSNGVITKSYDFISFDSSSQQYIHYPNQIKHAVVFPFDIPTDTNLVYRFECDFKIPPEFLMVKMVRDRKFTRFADEYVFGNKVRTAHFSITEFYDIEDKEKGGFWNQTKYKSEVYAEGYGLIRTIEKTDAGTITQFLHRVYNLPDINKD